MGERESVCERERERERERVRHIRNIKHDITIFYYHIYILTKSIVTSAVPIEHVIQRTG